MRIYEQVYQTVKIHKIKANKSITVRLICTTPGNINHGLSKQIEFYLQAAVRSIKLVLKDSFDLMKSINKLKHPLPKGCKVFTADSESCYLNLIPEDAIETVIKYLIEYEGKIEL